MNRTIFSGKQILCQGPLSLILFLQLVSKVGAVVLNRVKGALMMDAASLITCKHSSSSWDMRLSFLFFVLKEIWSGIAMAPLPVKYSMYRSQASRAVRGANPVGQSGYQMIVWPQAQCLKGMSLNACA